MANLLFATVCSLMLLATASAAKSLRIENDTDQSVTTVTVESEGKGKGPKQPKKDLVLGLASSANHGKGGKSEDGTTRSHKDVDVEVAEDNCIATLTFTLGNGKNLRTPQLDLCNLDGVIVEEPLDEPPLN